MVGDSLEQLRKRLYKRGEIFKERVPREKLFSPRDSKNFKKGWWSSFVRKKKMSRRELIDSMRPKPKKFPFFLIFLILVFLAGAVVVGFYYFSQRVVVSPKNIEITFNGPISVNAGEFNIWNLMIKNKNQAILKSVYLTIEYPEGTIFPEKKPLLVERRKIGDLYVDETKIEKIAVAFLGSEGGEKKLKAILEYRLEGTSASFVKTNVHTVKLIKSPVGIKLELPQEIESGQEVDMKIEYVSNSEVGMEGLELRLEYPPGYRYLNSDPKPAASNNVWKIGDLAPHQTGALVVRGVLEGQDRSEVSFRAIIGRSTEELQFFELSQTSRSILVKKSILTLDYVLRKEDEVGVSAGKTVNVNLLWRNNLPTELYNVVIKTKLGGEIFEPTSVSVRDGFFQSRDNTIVWNVSSMPELKIIKPSEEKSLSFSLKIKESIPVHSADDKNFTLLLSGEISATKSTEEGRVLVKSTTEKTIKVISTVQLASRLLYSTGPFKNSGPLPPKVDKETTYTITWSLTNFYNNLSNVEVRAPIPASYVRFTGIVEPSGIDLVYNEKTSEVVWKIGKVEAATGLLVPAKRASFQLAFLPSINQLGQSPKLIFETTIEGEDTFTGAKIKYTIPVLQVDEVADPDFKKSQGVVVR
jgi:hypothetical protein